MNFDASVRNSIKWCEELGKSMNTTMVFNVCYKGDICGQLAAY
jgi:hypothetical protein